MWGQRNPKTRWTFPLAFFQLIYAALGNKEAWTVNSRTEKVQQHFMQQPGSVWRQAGFSTQSSPTGSKLLNFALSSTRKSNWRRWGKGRQGHMPLSYCSNPCWKHQMLTRKKVPVLCSGTKRHRGCHTRAPLKYQHPLLTLSEIWLNLTIKDSKYCKVMNFDWIMMNFFFYFSLLLFSSLHHLLSPFSFACLRSKRRTIIYDQ